MKHDKDKNKSEMDGYDEKVIGAYVSHDYKWKIQFNFYMNGLNNKKKGNKKTRASELVFFWSIVL